MGEALIKQKKPQFPFPLKFDELCDLYTILNPEDNDFIQQIKIDRIRPLRRLDLQAAVINSLNEHLKNDEKFDPDIRDIALNVNRILVPKYKSYLGGDKDPINYEGIIRYLQRHQQINDENVDLIKNKVQDLNKIKFPWCDLDFEDLTQFLNHGLNPIIVAIQMPSMNSIHHIDALRLLLEEEYDLNWYSRVRCHRKNMDLIDCIFNIIYIKQDHSDSIEMSSYLENMFQYFSNIKNPPIQAAMEDLYPDIPDEIIDSINEFRYYDNPEEERDDIMQRYPF